MAKKKRGKFILFLIVIVILAVLYFIYSDKLGSFFTPDQQYLDNQVYCVKDSDCLNPMENCFIKGVLNCRNKYFDVSDRNCSKLDLGITEVSKCLCDEETNSCKLGRS